MRQKLMSNNVFCYHKVYAEFANRAKEVPQDQEGMKEVKKEQDEQCEKPCKCLRGNEQKSQKIEL